jgi:hypothetical protein
LDVGDIAVDGSRILDRVGADGIPATESESDVALW